MRAIWNLLVVLSHKIAGPKTDFFLSYKYHDLKKYYGENCLDVGAGTSRFSKFVSENGHKIQPIDIVDKCEFDELNLQLFDGENISFDDNAFDTTLLMFVLHHTDVQDALIEECKRVTKGYILIAEDVIRNRFDKIMGNIHLGTSPWSKSENGFRTDAEWIRFFQLKKLAVIDSLVISRSVYPVYPVSRKIYVLKAN